MQVFRRWSHSMLSRAPARCCPPEIFCTHRTRRCVNVLLTAPACVGDLFARPNRYRNGSASGSDSSRVADSNRDRRESVLTTATCALSGKEDSSAATHAVCETRAGCLEQVLLVGTSARHRAIKHIRSLAPGGIPIVLALEIETGRTAATAQEPANVDPHHGGR